MINPDSPTTEVLPGFTRADLAYLADCLEGGWGEGRRAEAAPQAALFIRAALARPVLMQAYAPTAARPRLLTPGRAPTDNDLEAAQPAFVLTESERRMIEKQRAHAERNRGDEEDGNGGIPT